MGSNPTPAASTWRRRTAGPTRLPVPSLRLGSNRRVAVAAAVAIGILASAGWAEDAAASTRWCGSDRASVDRKPDAVAGQQWHVVYATPSDAPDRSGEVVHGIAADVATIDRWWRRQDGARTPRFDLHAFPACSGFDALDVSFLRLPNGSAAYFAPSSGQLRADVEAAGFNHRFKKYLVYYDGPIEQAGICGWGFTGYPFTGIGGADAVVLMRGGSSRGTCGLVGDGAYAAKTAAHEILHALNAVAHPLPSPPPPNVCADDHGHVCDNPEDLLYPGARFGALEPYILDVGRDDYYGHSGSWWDVRDSAWLARLDAPQFRLDVRVAGASAAERIVSEAPGIECPTACGIAWDAGTVVRLLASPEQGRRVAWGPPCRRLAETCEVTMNGPTAVSARFEAETFDVSARVRGHGTIRSRPAGVSCPPRCAASFPARRDVRFTAHPRRGWRFVRWTGDCAGRGRCVLELDGNARLVARFARR